MFFGAFPAADPEDDGDQHLDAGGFGLCHSRFGLFRCHALLYLLQGCAVAGFQTGVGHRQSAKISSIFRMRNRFSLNMSQKVHLLWVQPRVVCIRMLSASGQRRYIFPS
jgi:hypothetical protein